MGSLLLIGEKNASSNLPALNYTNTENLRDVSNVIWEQDISKADQLDYLTAVACGAVSGLIDLFFVGEFSLNRANTWGKDQTNRFVKNVAALTGYKGDDLSDAIRSMEKRFPFAADTKTSDFGGGLHHHLRDFSHHFSIGGLLCSLFTQFTGKVIGTDTNGNLLIAELTDTTLIGKNFEEKLLFGTIRWFFHIVSDMAGSSTSAGNGTGIPGVMLSLLKELSVIPCFKDKKINETEFHIWVSKLFNGTLLAKRDQNGTILEPVRFDLRTEIGVLHEVGRQFIPVVINECLVRGLYFLRRLYNSVQNTKIESISDFKNLESYELLPFNNRVITRMITVASGVFTAVDIVDAAVQSVIKNGGINPKLLVDFAVRINIVGVGRFIIACKADASLIAEDIQAAKAQRDSVQKEYEKMIADLKCLSLDNEQMRALYSLEKLILLDDLRITKDKKQKAAKQEWITKWDKQVIKTLPIVSDNFENIFMSEEEIAVFIDDHDEAPWKYLIAMESLLFSPYCPIFEIASENRYKKLKCKSAYLTETFVKKLSSISQNDFNELKKCHKQSAAKITGSTKNIIVGAVGTTVLVAASGGLAFMFAPAIATALVGEAAAGLSGAALTSYSLAAIGGGSLAAGGLGMAGGTAIITGGGALVGMLGGTGFSAAAALNLLADDSYVLSECCKLLTFSKVVLADRFQDINTVFDIQTTIASRLDDLQAQLEQLSYTKDSKNEDKNQAKGRKAKIKVAKKSIKYLKNTNYALEKLIKKNEANTSAALQSPPNP